MTVIKYSECESLGQKIGYFALAGIYAGILASIVYGGIKHTTRRDKERSFAEIAKREGVKLGPVWGGGLENETNKE